MKKIYTMLLLYSFVSGIGIYAQELSTAIENEDELIKWEISDNLNLDLPLLKWEEQVKNDPFGILKYEGFNQRYTHSVDDIYYSLYGNLTVFPGLNTTEVAGGEIAVLINRSFLVNFGAYGLKYDYNFGSQPYYDAVLHLDASYKVLPWLSVGAYGQYTAFSKYNAKNGSILHSPMIPYSMYGIHATTMFTESFGIHGAVGKELNPINGKWQNVYGISPVINLNKLFR